MTRAASRPRPDPPRADQERARRDRRRDGDRAHALGLLDQHQDRARHVDRAAATRDGRLIAQGLTLPVHLGSIPDAMAAIRAKFPDDDMQPGRRVLAQRPVPGRHPPARLLPAQADLRGRAGRERRVGWSVSVGHQTDVGGKTAGRQRLRTPPRSTRRGCASRRSSCTSAGGPVPTRCSSCSRRTCGCRTRSSATCGRRSPPA